MMKAKNWVIIIVFLLLFLPAPSAIPSPSKPTFKIDRMAAEGYVAFVVNEKPAGNTDLVDPQKCECAGTKVITHGDGHKTPCQCLLNGTDCNCASNKQDELVEEPPKPQEAQEPVQPKEPKKQKTIMYFTASWCGPCQSFKINELPKLQKAGLSTSFCRDGQVTDIEVVDIDLHRDMYTSYNCGGVPYFVILNDKHEIVKRYQGYTKAETMLEAWNGLK
jgi:thiol-disulfide isomerase/thioredoxin